MRYFYSAPLYNVLFKKKKRFDHIKKSVISMTFKVEGTQTKTDAIAERDFSCLHLCNHVDIQIVIPFHCYAKNIDSYIYIRCNIL